MPTLFNPPVRVTSDQPGVTIDVSSVEKAAEQLLAWRTQGVKRGLEQGLQWSAAVACCMAAVEGTGSAESARLAFIEAASAAGVLLED